MRDMLKAAIILSIGFLAMPAAALAQSTIRATVNDVPITSYEVGQRVKLMTLFHQKTSPKIALEDLIDEEVVAQVAKPRKLGPTDAQVNDRFDAIAKQVKLTPANFVKALKQNGVEPDTLRKLFRAQMTYGMVLRAKAGSTAATVSEADIQAELAKKGLTPDQATMKEYMLQQVVFVIPKGSTGMVPARMRDAESFRKRFTGCDGSLALAKSMKGVVVLDPGRRDSTQIDGAFGEALDKTPAGGSLKPETTERGVEVITVCSVKEIQSTAGIRAEAEKKLAEDKNKNLESTLKADLRKDAKIVYN